MDLETLTELHKQGFNKIPVSCEIAADLETPLSIYLKTSLGSKSGSFLFESMQGGERWGRYSIIGMPCTQRLEIHGNDIRIYSDDQLQSQLQHTEPLKWLEEYQNQYKMPVLEGLPRFCGGLVGYFGYDTVRHIEPRLGENPLADPLATPDMMFLLCDELCVFDNIAGTATLIAMADAATDANLEMVYAETQKRLEALRIKLLAPVVVPMDEGNRTVSESDFTSEFPEQSYKSAVRVIKDYITAGDCMQVVLSQRLSTPFGSQPINLYRALRRLNPSPYMFYINAGDHQIVGASPEILVRLEDEEVAVRPIAGTRPRGVTPEEDQKLEKDLLADPKELAEHLMLIDLGRNDVGRIAETGSVKVTEQMAIERYSHVMHIVSNVTGRLADQLSNIDVLRATFPAGTLSGAPKVRAMEIIQELEPVKRGIYGGAIGYLSWNGNMDTCIAIRTAVIKNETLYVQAGAGIVYDSDPQSEWDETMAKARAIFRAVAMAEKGIENAIQQPKQPQPPGVGGDA